jgi:carboxypeptidase Q
MSDLSVLDRTILGEVWTSSSLWNNLVYLCDVCGGRLSTSDDERRAAKYLIQRFEEIGLDHVHSEPFEMPHWVRGATHLTMHDANGSHELYSKAAILSPSGNVEREVIDAGRGTEAEFTRLGEKIANHIVLTSSDGANRLEKYIHAQAAGAAAILYGSDQPGMVIPAASLGLRSELPLIPAVSLAHESTAYLQRQLQAGSVTARLVVESIRQTGIAINISADLWGSQPEQGWIIACAHYDGHDISQAAQDNASGTAVILEAARLLAPLRSYLKVGIRFILFSGEEEGIWGSPAYVAAHMADLDQIRAVFNADIVGCAAPLLLKTQNSPDLAAFLKNQPLADLGAALDENDFICNSDHFSFTAHGISSLWAVTSPAPQGKYWVHSDADTLDKLDLNSLRQAAATTARILLRLSVESENLPRERQSPEALKQSILSKGWETLLKLQCRCPF